MSEEQLSPETQLRTKALKHLKKRRDFHGHLLIYTLVNAFFIVIWAVTSSGGFFWPIFPLVGWGIGVIMNAWDVYVNEDFDEDQIQAEMRHLQKR